MARPQTIQIFLPAGDPRGMRVAEITTRIVRVIEVPRSQLGEFVKMPEAQQVGVYFLMGESSEAGLPRAYIGQSGNVGTRLVQHNQSKDFWNRAFVVISLTNSMTQTHALFLEWFAISEATKAGRYTLENGNTGARPHTPAPLEADCHEIHETAATLLATMGQPIFEPLTNTSTSSTDWNYLSVAIMQFTIVSFPAIVTNEGIQTSSAFTESFPQTLVKVSKKW
jgi:hypothetical protein